MSKEHFPLSVSLQPLVLQRFADPSRSASDGQAMPRDELIAYIRSSDRLDLDPLQSVLVQTEQIGDPALPTPADSAALAWVGASLDHWQKHYPLDEALAQQLRRLQPVLALMALADPQFSTPGIHPLHQALDAIQAAAVGWQDDLGRAGEPLLKLVEQTVDDALACLEDNGAGLMALLRASSQSAERLETRLQRMSKRAADVERGQLRAARARITAAKMINGQISRFPIPAEIGQFLTGPWYESAQLVFLKFGERAEQWRDFTATTESLVNSLQPAEGDAGRLDSVADISRGLHRWLLSLQHDQQAAEQAISAIEYVHLRVARGEDIQRDSTALIEYEDKSGEPGNNPIIAGLEVGQWFMVQARKGGNLRIQLAMRQDEEQRLLFCNHAGARVQAMGFASFARLLEEEKAVALEAGASFSRSLAAVVGIDNQESLRQLNGDAAPAQPAEEIAEVEAVAASAASVAEELPPLELNSEEPSKPQLPDSGVPELPMGTWLGFHDIDPPLLAKLALHDKVRRLFIFVDRKGVEQRRLEEDAYLELIKTGQVDILETKVNFREQVERARDRMKRHQS